MESLAFVEFLLKNYEEMKKRAEYLGKLLASPLFVETYDDTIEELNYKREDFQNPSRGP